VGAGSKARACELLKELKSLIERSEELPPTALFHVKRAAELVKCNPERPAADEKRLFEEEGIIVE